MHKEALEKVHPIFRLPLVEVILTEQVQKQSKGHFYISQNLVIATPAVFMLKWASTGEYKLGKMITWYDLTTINVEDNIIHIKSPVCQLSLKTSKSVQIAKTISELRAKIINTENLHFTVYVNRRDQNKYDLCELSLPKISPLSSAFISAILRTHHVFNLDQINAITNRISSTVDSVTIDSEIASSPYLESLCYALAFTKHCKQITLKNFPLAEFLPFCSLVFQLNTSLQYVNFHEITFNDTASQIQSVVKNIENHSPFYWRFVNCDFSSLETASFFEKLNSGTTPVEGLIFSNCQFSQQTFEIITQTIFFNMCFHSLRILSLIDMSVKIDIFLIELMSCEFILKSQCLENLTLSNCNLELSEIFPLLFKFNTGVCYYNLNKNSFCKTVQLFPLSSNIVLSLSECVTNSNSLLSLFDVIKKSGSVVRLDLSNLKIDEQDFSFLIKELSSTCELSLLAINLKGNPIKIEDFSHIVNFITKQTFLREVALSDIPEDVEESLLIQLVQKSLLEKLHITSQGKHRLGGKLLKPLEIVFERGNIVDLDVSGQAMGSPLISLLSNNLNSSLRRLRFDGNLIEDTETLIHFCEAVLDSDIEYAGFPENDFLRLQDNKYQQKTEELKHLFYSRLGERLLDEKTNRNSYRGFGHDVSKHRRTPSSRSVKQSGNFGIVGRDMEQLLIETGNEGLDDPFDLVWEKFVEETSLEKLSKNLV